MAKTVKIILDNYVNDVCYPGQTLSGRVECSFNTEEKVKEIYEGYYIETLWIRRGYPLTIVTSNIETTSGPGSLYIIISVGYHYLSYGLNVPLDAVEIQLVQEGFFSPGVFLF